MSADTRTLKPADLPNNRPTPFTVIADSDELAKLGNALGVAELRKLRFEGKVVPDGASDWRLDGQLGATVVQPCVVTGDPVVTRVEEKITRRFIKEPPELPDSDEIEMPEDDTLETVPEEIDLLAIAFEGVSLALPAYPRREGVEMDQTAFGPPGADPLTDAAVRPFAGLADLKERMLREDGE